MSTHAEPLASVSPLMLDRETTDRETTDRKTTDRAAEVRATGGPRVREREFALPVVTALATPTAHPLPEAWPAAPQALEGRDGPPREGLPASRDRNGSKPSAPSRSSRRRSRSGARPASLLTLAAMDGSERARRFAELQRRMATVCAAVDTNREGQSIVVVPSRTIDKWEEAPAETQAYEERLLCLLLLLRQPHLQVIYVTSQPIDRAIIDYYLSLLPAELLRDARARLTLLTADDASRSTLAEKLLARPRLLERIRRAIPDPELCHLVPYCPTDHDRDLALLLGIPMYGADPRHARFGTKSGCRELFAQESVPHPLGVENITDLAAAIRAIVRIRAEKPEILELVIKLNEGVSGDGNAIIDLHGLPQPGAEDEASLIEQRVRAMAFEAPGASLDAYLAKLMARGGIVEERITGAEVRSPSVQLQVTPTGGVEVISTHDQLLGGPSGQSYLGCQFPADRQYAGAITDEARKIGRRLAREGVIGRFAIDFLVVRDRTRRWQPYAIELNLRKGGTTHPFLALALLTAGTYDAQMALFTTPAGSPKYVVATDHLEAAQLRHLELHDVLEIIGRRNLRFDDGRRSGVVFHMLSAVNEAGRLGLTAIGDTPAEAELAYRRARAVLLEEAAAVRRSARAASRLSLRPAARVAAAPARA